MNYTVLIQEAQRSKENSYSPYSNFRVGSAVITNDEKIYTGCNVENSSYGLTNCAERTALFNAISSGEKVGSFKAIVVVSDLEDFCPPCGACRQVISDLCGCEIDVVLANVHGDYKIIKFKELLPYAFGDNDLKKK